VFKEKELDFYKVECFIKQKNVPYELVKEGKCLIYIKMLLIIQIIKGHVSRINSQQANMKNEYPPHVNIQDRQIDEIYVTVSMLKRARIQKINHDSCFSRF
jgi:spore coat protein CotH